MKINIIPFALVAVYYIHNAVNLMVQINGCIPYNYLYSDAVNGVFAHSWIPLFDCVSLFRSLSLRAVLSFDRQVLSSSLWHVSYAECQFYELLVIGKRICCLVNFVSFLVFSEKTLKADTHIQLKSLNVVLCCYIQFVKMDNARMRPNEYGLIYLILCVRQTEMHENRCQCVIE